MKLKLHSHGLLINHSSFVSSGDFVFNIKEKMKNEKNNSIVGFGFGCEYCICR